jgi:hypothetical protein
MRIQPTSREKKSHWTERKEQLSPNGPITISASTTLPIERQANVQTTSDNICLYSAVDSGSLAKYRNDPGRRLHLWRSWSPGKRHTMYIDGLCTSRGGEQWIGAGGRVQALDIDRAMAAAAACWAEQTSRAAAAPSDPATSERVRVTTGAGAGSTRCEGPCGACH